MCCGWSLVGRVLCLAHMKSWFDLQYYMNQVWWFTPVILVLRRERQEDQFMVIPSSLESLRLASNMRDWLKTTKFPDTSKMSMVAGLVRLSRALPFPVCGEEEERGGNEWKPPDAPHGKRKVSALGDLQLTDVSRVRCRLKVWDAALQVNALVISCC